MRILGGVAALAVVLATATGAQAGGWVPGSADPLAGETRPLDGDGAAIAGGRDGTVAVAAMVRTGAGAERVVRAAVRPPGGAWAVTTLATPPTAGTKPSVGVDAQGGVTVAWVSGAVVHAAYRPPGGGFGPVQDVSGSDAQEASVAVGDGGGAIVVWRTATTVQGALRSNGATTFQAPSAISEAGVSIYGAPQAAMDPAGDVAVIWQRNYDPGGGNRYVTEASVKGVTQPWPTTTPGRRALSSTTTGNSGTYYHRIAMLPNGSLVALYDYSDGTNGRVYARDRVVGSGGFAAGTWSAASVPIGASATEYADLAVDDGGGAYATWFSASTRVVSGAIRPALGAFTDAPIGADATDGQERIAASPAGDVTAVWSTSSGGDRNLIAARRAPGGTFGAPESLLTLPVAGGANALRGVGVATDDQGNAYAIVTQVIGSANVVAVKTYDNAAPALGVVTVPGTATAGQAVAFGASATDRIDATPSIRWDFGDGAVADGASASHAYAAAGTYAVKATATDDAGNASSATRVVTVAPAPPAGGGGPIKGGPPVIVEPLKPPPFARAGARFKHLRGGRTAFTKLTLSGLKKGDGVKLSCSGGGCALLGRKAKKVTAKKGSLDLLPYVKRLKLAPKAKLRITVSRKAYTSVKITYTMVKGKDPKRALA